MRILCFVALLPGLLFAVDANHPAQPQDASHGIIQAFKTHTIVMFGETPENKQEYEFLRSLVASPQFADKVDDIVVEYGNSFYQEAVDRYIAGQNVP